MEKGNGEYIEYKRKFGFQQQGETKHADINEMRTGLLLKL